ncbi:MAG TPA: MFS transporter [Actinoplanes sp.]|nr:MFS transporter [Actinoplanes sp.]
MKQLNDLIADFWRDYAALVLLAAGLLGVILLIALGIWAKRSKKPLRPIALAVSMNLALLLNAEGMWVIAIDQLKLPAIFAVLVFAVFEICFLTATSLAAEQYRRTSVYAPNGTIVTAGHPGPMLWIAALIAGLSGIIVASNAVTFTEQLLRLAVPCMIFLMWWAALTAAGQKVRRGRFAYSPRRLAERWGFLIPDDDPDLVRMGADRQVRRMVVNYHRVSAGRFPKPWWRNRLLKDARTAGEPVVEEVVEQLARIQRVMDLLVPGAVRINVPARPESLRAAAAPAATTPDGTASLARELEPNPAGTAPAGPQSPNRQAVEPVRFVQPAPDPTPAPVEEDPLALALTDEQADAMAAVLARQQNAAAAQPAPPQQAAVPQPASLPQQVASTRSASLPQQAGSVQPSSPSQPVASVQPAAAQPVAGPQSMAGFPMIPAPPASQQQPSPPAVSQPVSQQPVASGPSQVAVPAQRTGDEATLPVLRAGEGATGPRAGEGATVPVPRVAESPVAEQPAPPAIPAWASTGTGARPAVSIVGSPWWRLAVDRLSKLVAEEITPDDLPEMNYLRITELTRKLAPKVSELGEGVIRTYINEYVRELDGEHVESAYPWRDFLPAPAPAKPGSEAWLAALADLRTALEEELGEGQPMDPDDLTTVLAPSAPRLDERTVRAFIGDYLLALNGMAAAGVGQPWAELMPRPQSIRPASDEDVLEVHGAELFEHLRSTGKLSRYKVQAVTGIKSRVQADRIKATVESRAAETASA